MPGIIRCRLAATYNILSFAKRYSPKQSFKKLWSHCQYVLTTQISEWQLDAYYAKISSIREPCSLALITGTRQLTAVNWP